MTNQVEHLGPRRTQRGQDFGHFGNDHACFADHNSVSDADVLSADLVLVVQCGPGHG